MGIQTWICPSLSLRPLGPLGQMSSQPSLSRTKAPSFWYWGLSPNPPCQLWHAHMIWPHSAFASTDPCSFRPLLKRHLLRAPPPPLSPCALVILTHCVHGFLPHLRGPGTRGGVGGPSRSYAISSPQTERSKSSVLFLLPISNMVQYPVVHSGVSDQ